MTNQTDVNDESRAKSAVSEIAQFFSGRKVLVTGGLGFLGKLLIEKLLRCCPNVATLYVLVRGKNGKNPQERVEELAEMPIFAELRKERPDFLRKVTVIESDLDLPNLGLSPRDRDRLLDANVVFHGAGILRSNQRLRTMTNVNVRATKEMLLLAKEMSGLKAFVHLSTVFAQAPFRAVEEKHYSPPMGTDELLSLVNILSDDDRLDRITPTLIGVWPNTFAYTKAVAEEAVLRYGDGIPACIVRPSVVTSTWREPLEGWSDSVYGPVGLLAGISLGLVRTINCAAGNKLDFVPADYVTSSLIAAAWDTGVRKSVAAKEPREDDAIVTDVERVPVYNYVSSSQRPITWDTFRKYVRAYGGGTPGVKTLRPQCMFWNGRQWLHRILLWLFHLLPAIVVDAAAVCTGRDASWRGAYKLIDAHLTATSYFMTRQWWFHDEAVVKLWERMSAADREIFAFDVSAFDWREYTKRMIAGIRAFVDEKTPWERAVQAGLAEYVEL